MHAYMIHYPNGLNNNDLDQVADQRFSLKQWFAVGAHYCRLRKPGSGHCYLRILVENRVIPGNSRYQTPSGCPNR